MENEYLTEQDRLQFARTRVTVIAKSVIFISSKEIFLKQIQAKMIKGKILAQRFGAVMTTLLIAKYNKTNI